MNWKTLGLALLQFTIIIAVGSFVAFTIITLSYTYLLIIPITLVILTIAYLCISYNELEDSAKLTRCPYCDIVVCPHCGESNNIEKYEWFTCKECMKKPKIGAKT